MTKLQKAIVIVCMVILAGFIGMARNSQLATVQSNGKLVTREMEDGMAEMESLLAHIKPGDVDSLKNLPEPKTEIGRQLKGTLLKIVEVDARYQKESTFDVTECGKIEQLGGTKFINHCFEGLRSYRIAEKNHLNGQIEISDLLMKFALDNVGKAPEKAAIIKVQDKEVYDLAVAVADTGEKVVTFARDHRQERTVGDSVLCLSGTNKPKFIALFQKFSDAIDVYSDRSKKQALARQAELAEGLKGIGKK